MEENLEVDDSDTIKVLHVDDEEDQLMFTKFFLEQLDRKLIIDSVSNPEEVQRLQSQNCYDIVISDYVMPNITGIELFYRVRKRSDVPFILYTGKSSDEIEEFAYRAGIEGYLRKGTEPNHYLNLLNLIRSILEKRKKEREIIHNVLV